MTVALETLSRCRDPVLGASRVLMSVDGKARMRGLETLRCLPRGVQAEAVSAEVSAGLTVVEMGLDSSRDCAERQQLRHPSAPVRGEAELAGRTVQNPTR